MKAEDSLQIAVANYLRLAYPKVLWAHIANERQTSPQRGSKLKKMGVRAGMPDILIFKANKYYHGLFLELKTVSPLKKDGTVKKDEHLSIQNDIHRRLLNEGYYAKFVVGFDDAKKNIDDYLK